MVRKQIRKMVGQQMAENESSSVERHNRLMQVPVACRTLIDFKTCEVDCLVEESSRTLSLRDMMKPVTDTHTPSLAVRHSASRLLRNGAGKPRLECLM